MTDEKYFEVQSSGIRRNKHKEKGVTYKLLARKKPVGHELSGSDGNSLVRHGCGFKSAAEDATGDLCLPTTVANSRTREELSTPKP